MTWEIKNRFTGQVIRSGGGDNLLGANLSGANLSGACVVDCGQRSDGYPFFIQFGLDDGPKVLAGCRYLPIKDARQHWRDTRDGTPLGDESLALISHGPKLGKIRGLK